MKIVREGAVSNSRLCTKSRYAGARVTRLSNTNNGGNEIPSSKPLLDLCEELRADLIATVAFYLHNKASVLVFVEAQ